MHTRFDILDRGNLVWHINITQIKSGKLRPRRNSVLNLISSFRETIIIHLTESLDMFPNCVCRNV